MIFVINDGYLPKLLEQEPKLNENQFFSGYYLVLNFITQNKSNLEISELNETQNRPSSKEPLKEYDI